MVGLNLCTDINQLSESWEWTMKLTPTYLTTLFSKTNAYLQVLSPNPAADKSFSNPIFCDHSALLSDRARIYSSMESRRMKLRHWTKLAPQNIGYEAGSTRLVLESFSPGPSTHDERVVSGQYSDDVHAFFLQFVILLKKRWEMADVTGRLRSGIHLRWAI